MSTPENIHAETGEFSQLLSDTLDVLGYNMDIIKHRQRVHSKIDEIYNSKAFSETHISTGSKGEGTALYYESDIDRMYVVKDVICFRDIDEALLGADYKDKTVFEIDSCNSKPGYTRLKLKQLAERDHKNEVLQALVMEESVSYISNTFSFFKTTNEIRDLSGSRVNDQGRHGPALKFANRLIKYDFVFGFLYACPDLIEKWVSRPRYGDWPTKELITYISKLDGHVVPVANKGSRYQRTEWRICLTLAEQALVHSLEEFHIKLYIFLKLVTKATLNPICKEITSYIIKNVTFWMFEKLPTRLFSKELLFDRLIDMLVYLKQCIEAGELSSYMIKDRNLFEGRISLEETKLLTNKLSELVTEKENLFVHCPKISTAIEKMKEDPSTLRTKLKKMSQCERLNLQKSLLFKEHEFPGMTGVDVQICLDKIQAYISIDQELRELMIPDKEDLLEEGQDVEAIFTERLYKILS